MPKIRKRSSKRIGLREKYAVQKKVKEHHRKIKKQARKLAKSGIKPHKSKKGNQIPNSFPNKEMLINEMEAEFTALQEAQKAKREQGTVTFEEKVAGQVFKQEEDDKAKYAGMTKEEFEEAERLIDPEGV